MSFRGDSKGQMALQRYAKISEVPGQPSQKMDCTVPIIQVVLGYGGFPGGPEGKASACNVGDRVRSLGWEDPLEKEMATHSSTLAWKIPWTEEPGVAKSPTQSSDFTFFP